MADRLLVKMIKLSIIDKDDEEIYRFGFEALSLKIFHYITYLLIAVFFREAISFTIFFMAFLLLRKSAGGYHAKTKVMCYIASCLTVVGVILCIKIIPGGRETEIVSSILVILADAIIYVIAPLGNRNRELDEEEIKYFRSRTRSLLMVENIAGLIIILIGKGEYVIPIAVAIIGEAVILLLEKLRENKTQKFRIYK